MLDADVKELLADQGLSIVEKQVALQFLDEAVALGSSGSAVSVAFAGAGVTAARVGDAVTITVPGGGGGGGGGSVATDTIFDAKGDLPVGTGADTAAKLAAGANDTVLVADSAQATGLKWITQSALKTLLALVKGDVGLGSVVNADTTTTTNITDSTNKRFVTNAQQTVIGNTSGTNTGDQSLAGLQPLDSDLTTLAGLTPTTDNFIQSKASAWASRTVAQVKTDLGLTGTNSGDQTITLTGGVTGSGTGSFAAAVVTNANLTGDVTSVGNAATIGANKVVTSMILDANVTLAKLANVASGTVFYRKTAGAGAPEVNTLAMLKTDLGLTGTNSGDTSLEILDEGASVITDPANLNFVGAGVTVSTLLGDTTVTISGGGGGGGSGITRSVVVTSANYTLGATALTDYVYLVAGLHTGTLPTAVGNLNRYTVKNNHTVNVSLGTTGGQTIDGTTTISISPESSVDLISTGSHWSVI